MSENPKTTNCPGSDDIDQMSEPWMQQAPPQATPQSTASQKRCDTDTYNTLIINGLSLLNVACCGLMVFSSVLTFFLVRSKEEIDLAFVSLYTILFAAILFIYEGLNFGWLEYPRSAYRKQLGFLYKPFGRALFLIFTGFLCFGLRAQPGEACSGYKGEEDDADCNRDNKNYLG